MGGQSENPYYSWDDSAGVCRRKEDNARSTRWGSPFRVATIPQFTKYVPGAANYERIVQEWNSNISEIGNYAGGTGTVRDLRLMAPTIHVGTASNLSGTTFTGAGTNDGVFGGTYTGATLTYCAIIDATGTPDTFEWGTNGGCSNGATGVAITGTKQALSSGVSITLPATKNRPHGGGQVERDGDGCGRLWSGERGAVEISTHSKQPARRPVRQSSAWTRRRELLVCLDIGSGLCELILISFSLPP